MCMVNHCASIRSGPGGQDEGEKSEPAGAGHGGPHGPHRAGGGQRCKRCRGQHGDRRGAHRFPATPAQPARIRAGNGAHDPEKNTPAGQASNREHGAYGDSSRLNERSHSRRTDEHPVLQRGRRGRGPATGTALEPMTDLESQALHEAAGGVRTPDRHDSGRDELNDAREPNGGVGGDKVADPLGARGVHLVELQKVRRPHRGAHDEHPGSLERDDEPEAEIHGAPPEHRICHGRIGVEARVARPDETEREHADRHQKALRREGADQSRCVKCGTCGRGRPDRDDGERGHQRDLDEECSDAREVRLRQFVAFGGAAHKPGGGPGRREPDPCREDGQTGNETDTAVEVRSQRHARAPCAELASQAPGEWMAETGGAGGRGPHAPHGEHGSEERAAAHAAGECVDGPCSDRCVRHRRRNRKCGDTEERKVVAVGARRRRLQGVTERVAVACAAVA